MIPAELHNKEVEKNKQKEIEIDELKERLEHANKMNEEFDAQNKRLKDGIDRGKKQLSQTPSQELVTKQLAREVEMRKRMQEKYEEKLNEYNEKCDQNLSLKRENLALKRQLKALGKEYADGGGVDEPKCLCEEEFQQKLKRAKDECDVKLIMVRQQLFETPH